MAIKIKKQINKNVLIPREIIERKIYLIRGKKVMLDKDLATLYGVETRALNQAVRRNIKRFPEDFMFKLAKDEMENLRSQFVTSNLKSQFVTSSWGGVRKAPLAFTEPGVAMLSSVLKSEKAIQVNILIIRMFIKLRELLSSNSELRAKIELLESKYDNKFKIVFDAIREIQEAKKADIKRIGEIGFKG